MDISLMTDISKRKYVEGAITKMFDLIRPNLKQEKGQRIFKPFWDDNVHISKPQGVSCEIFVGRLPRDAFEGELIPLFGSLGEIYESRLMMDFSGFTRGFCYVTYTAKEMADFAIKHLHGIRIRPNGDKICCYRSLDNKMLFLEGLPTHKSIDEIERALITALPGIHKVVLYADPEKDRANLGVGFVEFVDHRSAANCRKYLWPARLNLWNSTVSVEWAIPLPKYTKDNVLLIKNIDANLSKSGLHKELMKYIDGNIRIVNLYKRCNYAVLQFISKKDALFAFHFLNGQVIGRKPIVLKHFDMTEDGENKLMLELQMYEWYARTKFCIPSKGDVDFSLLNAVNSTVGASNLSCTVLEQYVSANNFPRTSFLGTDNNTGYGLLNYWNQMMIESNVPVVSPYLSSELSFPDFYNQQ